MSNSASIRPLPWHGAGFERTIPGQGFHHGTLVSGLPGIGKREFSIALARRLLCLSEDPLQCNGCQSCQLFDAGTHPDFHVVCSEKETLHGRIPLLAEYSNRYQDIAARERKKHPSLQIPVEPIRLLIQRFVQSPHISASRVVILVPADQMNTNAANALLKLLEEPPEDSYMLLVSARPESLPATVRSRCVDLHLAPPEDSQAVQWLGENCPGKTVPEHLPQLVASRGDGPLDILCDLQNGQIEQAQNNLAALVQMLQGNDQPVSLAGVLAKQDIGTVLEWLQNVTTDLIRVQHDRAKIPWEQVESDSRPVYLAPIPAQGLFHLYAKLGRYRQMARDQLNAQLALEDILIGMQRLFRPGRTRGSAATK